MEEMDTSGELEESQDCPAADACVNLSPVMWESLARMDEAVTVG